MHRYIIRSNRRTKIRRKLMFIIYFFNEFFFKHVIIGF